MIVTCSACGYESPVSARFCRQCGVQLSAAFGVTEATTRNFGRQETPPVMTKESAPLPPHLGDAMAGNTARYQSAVGGADYRPPVHFYSVKDTSSLKSPRRLLKWGGFVLALLISGGMGAAINQSANRGRIFLSPEDRAALRQIQAERNLANAMIGAVAQQRERSSDELERRLAAIERAIAEAERAGKRPPLLSSDAQVLDLNPFRYQGAAISQEFLIPGNEMLQQQTADDFDMVVRSYQQKLGDPVAQITERNRQRSVFQAADNPDVTVLVSEGRGRGRQTEISVLRSPYRFARPQAQQKKADVPLPTSPTSVPQKAVP